MKLVSECATTSIAFGVRGTRPSNPAKESNASGGHVVARSVMLRVFAVSDGAQSWRVLPGGLARVAGATPDIASMQRGGSSADVWALTTGEVDKTTLLQPHLTPASLTQRKRLVTSRAAENLFWLGRYTERAENAIRLARLTLECLNGENSFPYDSTRLPTADHGIRRLGQGDPSRQRSCHRGGSRR